jgi:hypothetical protein
MATYPDLLAPRTPRAGAVEDLLRELEDLVVQIGSIPPEDRTAVLDRDAEKITAQVGRTLWKARGRLSGHPLVR